MGCITQLNGVELAKNTPVPPAPPHRHGEERLEPVQRRGPH